MAVQRPFPLPSRNPMPSEERFTDFIRQSARAHALDWSVGPVPKASTAKPSLTELVASKLGLPADASSTEILAKFDQVTAKKPAAAPIATLTADDAEYYAMFPDERPASQRIAPAALTADDREYLALFPDEAR